MELLSLFTRQAPNRMFLSMVLGTLSGVGYSMLIPIVLISARSRFEGQEQSADRVSTFLSFEVMDYKMAAFFALSCLVVLVARAAAQSILTRVALDATTQLRVEAYRAVLAAPIAGLEKVGTSKLLAVITADVPRIAAGAMLTPALLSSAVTLASTLCWLAAVDGAIFRLVIGAILFGVLTTQIPLFLARKYFERSRAGLDALYESIRGLIHGSKELKLSRVKRERFFEEVLLDNERVVRDNGKLASTVMTVTGNYGEMLGFLVIGVFAFVFVNYHAMDPEQFTTVIMVMLFITAPVAILVTSVPQIMMANVSVRAVKRVFGQLPREDLSEDTRPLDDWAVLRFEDVVFRYDDGRFTLGPISFEIARGEIVFIVGGNGSGKSTLGKLISLHYAASDGQVHIGDTRVNRETLVRCREQVAAIYADYYLFDRLLGTPEQESPTELDRHLRDLGLEGKLSVEAGRFTTRALSEGQKKRLALLVALLEKRQLYVLDEWAADQDPMFKDVFYSRILPDLKARGATVVVISHDNRYFHLADKILVMEDGRLIRTETPSPAPPTQTRPPHCRLVHPR